MSSEEPFNYIEHKIKEAAKNNEIVFEESSWKKMEALLDNEPRRKPFVWLWFLLPLAIAGIFGVFVMVNKQFEKQKTTTVQLEKTILTKKINTASFIKIADNAQLVNEPIKPVNNNSVSLISYNKKTNDFTSAKKSKQSGSSNNFKKININTPQTSEENVAQNENIFSEKSKTNFTVNNGSASANEIILGKITDTKTDSINDIAKTNIVEKKKTDSNTLVVKKEKETKKKQSTLSKFYVVGSFGADISSTKLFAFKNSPASLKYGLVVGFNINKKLSAQAGFYTGKKKYVANEGEYNFKTGSYYNMVRVTMVDANCIVYEIPVAVKYIIVQKKLINIYTGVGLSSYIMKNEDYNVHFIRNYMPYARAWNYTGNQHFLSNLIISAGAERKLTNKIALQIEPSINIPLKGVGEGSVKIFSTGLQVGLKYSPFK